MEVMQKKYVQKPSGDTADQVQVTENVLVFVGPCTLRESKSSAVSLRYKHYSLENTPNSIPFKCAIDLWVLHWPVGGVWLRTPWFLWRHRRFFSYTSCRCKRSPLRIWSSPLWSPRSAGDSEEHHKVKAKKNYYRIKKKTFSVIFTLLTKSRAAVHNTVKRPTVQSLNDQHRVC